MLNIMNLTLAGLVVFLTSVRFSVITFDIISLKWSADPVRAHLSALCGETRQKVRGQVSAYRPVFLQLCTRARSVLH